MTRRAFLTAALLVAGCALGAPRPAIGQALKSQFTTLARSNACSPFPTCAIPQRGVVTCPGGGEALPGLLPPWCPAGSRTMVRDRMMIYQIIETSDSRVSGSVILRFNTNLESTDFKGPFWGTYLIETPGRGTWEGLLEGVINSPTNWTYRVVLFGSGEFEGLQLRADGTWQAGDGDRLLGSILTPASRN